MMYSIDLPVGVSKSVADTDSVVSGPVVDSLESGELHQRSPGRPTARIDTPVPVHDCH